MVINASLPTAIIKTKNKTKKASWGRCCCCCCQLTVAVVKEVGDGGRGAATPRLGGINGGQDGRHEPLVAVDAEAFLAELGVVVGQAQQVT